MKFASVFTALATVAVSVSAIPGETNAQRMARGLPPLPPIRRASRLDSARRSVPSNTPSSCSNGNVQCCNSLTTSENPLVQTLSGLLGIVLGPDASGIGLGCSPLGIGASSCTQQTVCCNNNNFNGLIAIGCSPININL